MCYMPHGWCMSLSSLMPGQLLEVEPRVVKKEGDW
jgi:hypothetical protein